MFNDFSSSFKFGRRKGKPQGAQIVSAGLQVNLQTAPSSGSTWTDATGNYNATLNGTYTYSATNGGSITTTGNSYISTTYAVTAPFSICMIASFDPSTFWASLWGDEGYSPKKGYLAYFLSSTSMGFGSPTNEVTITVSDITTKAAWDFVVDASNNYVVYKNGVSISSGTATAPQNGVAGGGLFFGARHQNNSTTPTDYCPATFYNMRVYNTALSSENITSNYDALKGTYNLP